MLIVEFDLVTRKIRINRKGQWIKTWRIRPKKNMLRYFTKQFFIEFQRRITKLFDKNAIKDIKLALSKENSLISILESRPIILNQRLHVSVSEFPKKASVRYLPCRDELTNIWATFDYFFGFLRPRKTRKLRWAMIMRAWTKKPSIKRKNPVTQKEWIRLTFEPDPWVGGQDESENHINDLERNFRSVSVAEISIRAADVYQKKRLHALHANYFLIWPLL